MSQFLAALVGLCGARLTQLRFAHAPDIFWCARSVSMCLDASVCLWCELQASDLCPCVFGCERIFLSMCVCERSVSMCVWMRTPEGYLHGIIGSLAASGISGSGLRPPDDGSSGLAPGSAPPPETNSDLSTNIGTTARFKIAMDFVAHLAFLAHGSSG